MATNDGNGPFGAIAEFFSPSRPASAPLDAQTDHNNTVHNNTAHITPVNLDMSSGSGTEPDHDASAHPSARDTSMLCIIVRVFRTVATYHSLSPGHHTSTREAVGKRSASIAGGKRRK